MLVTDNVPKVFTVCPWQTHNQLSLSCLPTAILAFYNLKEELVESLCPVQDNRSRGFLLRASYTLEPRI